MKKREVRDPEVFDEIAYRYFHSKFNRPDIYRFVQLSKIKAIVYDYLRKKFKNVTIFDVAVVPTPTTLEIQIITDKPKVLRRRVSELSAYLTKMLGMKKHKLFREVNVQIYGKRPEDFVIEIERPDGSVERLSPESEGLAVMPDANYIARRIARAIERGRNYRAIIHGYLRALGSSPVVRGCEILVSGKLRGERARTERYSVGIVPKSGYPRDELVQHGFDEAVTRMGVIGVTVRLFLKRSLPDDVEMLKPEELPEDRLEALTKLKEEKPE